MKVFKLIIMFKKGNVKSHNPIRKLGIRSLMFSMGCFFIFYQCMKTLHKDNIYHHKSGDIDYLNAALNWLIK